ncbi:MAG TPA: aminoacyl-tRNA hydrolase [Patescibacteria group bacterium]|nr:aminoacyl-tRNA hydrolase [Patescibacteria group bacterium]
MKVIVGLGNPGEKYEKTRHNLGFLATEALLEKWERLDKTFWDDNHNLKSHIKKIRIKNHESGIKDQDILLVKPATFMNNSGFAVSKVLNYFKVEPADLFVIHDDLDLPFGKIRVRFGGGAGGHHGVESIIEQLSTDKFLRIRLGIGSPKHIEGKEVKSKNHQNVDDYVLGNITGASRGKVKTMLHEAVKIVDQLLEHGIDTYMSKYNK